MKAYYYLFYRIYSWVSSLKNDSTPEYSAFITVVVLSFFNLLAVFWLVNQFFGLPNLMLGLKAWQVISIGVSLAIPQYFLLIHQQKYKSIYEGFSSSETKKRKLLGTLGISVYIIFSVGMLYVAAFN